MTTDTIDTIDTTKVTPTESLQYNLSLFTGTEQYHPLSGLSNLNLTDGVLYLCNQAQCYWLMDIIASYQSQCNKVEMLRDFQIWTLKVTGSKGIVSCERDTNDIAFTQDIEYTDFPLPEIKLYCINNVILLSSEY